MIASIFYSMGAFAGALMIITSLSWLIDRYHGAGVDSSAPVAVSLEHDPKEHPDSRDNLLDYVHIDSRVLILEDGMMYERVVIGTNGDRFLTNKTSLYRNSVWDRKTGLPIGGFGPGRVHAVIVPEVKQ